MSFRVEPEALRTYASQLADAGHAAETAKRYVHEWGSFSAHEKGLFGMIFPAHRNYMIALDEMLQHLADLTSDSETTLKQQAGHYEVADLNAEARMDASYPEVPQPPPIAD